MAVLIAEPEYTRLRNDGFQHYVIAGHPALVLGLEALPEGDTERKAECPATN